MKSNKLDKKLLIVDKLKKSLESGKSEVKIKALKKVSASQDLFMLYVIKDFIKIESDEKVIVAMLITCAKIGGEEEIEFISKFFKHSSEFVKKEVVRVLELIESPLIYPYIYKQFSGNDKKLKKVIFNFIKRDENISHLENIKFIIENGDGWQKKSAISAKKYFISKKYGVEKLSKKNKEENLDLNSKDIEKENSIIKIKTLLLLAKKNIGKITILILLFAIFINPYLLTGTGSFVNIKNKKIINFIEKYSSLKIKENRLIEHRFWYSSLPLIDNFIGKIFIFIATSDHSKKSEIYSVRIFGTANYSASSLLNITKTEDASESNLIPMDDRFVYMAKISENIKIITVKLFDYSNNNQFIYNCKNSIYLKKSDSMGRGIIKVVENSEKKNKEFLVNVITGAVFPELKVIQFIPMVEGDEPFLPWLVEKVRNFSFVGPEKIAWLEDHYYGMVDYLKRKIYSGESENLEERNRLELKELKEKIKKKKIENRKKIKQFLSDSYNQIIKLYNSTLLAIQMWSNGKIKEYEREKRLARLRNEKLKQIIEKLSPYCIKFKKEIITDINKFLHSPPLPIAPLFKRWKIKGEGIWTSENLPKFEGNNYIFKTWIRPDLERGFARLYLVSIDLSKVELRLVAGTQEPVSSNGLHGSGIVPEKYIDDGSLFAVFNGGFRTKHGKWGFITEGLQYCKPRKGIATIAVDKKGKIYLGRWGKKVKDNINYLYLRQNLPPLVEDGKINRKDKYWGAAIDGKTNVWRSGIGITADGKRLIYGAGNSLSNRTLAKGLVMAGCVDAMQLDINDYHTYFIYHIKKKLKNGKIVKKLIKLSNKMSADSDRGIKTYTRDFFYLTWKKHKSEEITEK